MAGGTFPDKNREAEKSNDNFVRHAYTLYLPLREQCDLGRAAAVMDMEAAPEMEAVLNEVEDWNGFSIHSLAHALECGARFPLPERPLNIEEMNSIASRLAKRGADFCTLALRLAGSFGGRWQELMWSESLALAAVRTYSWTAKEQSAEQGMALARMFAEIEGKVLPRCYMPEMFEAERMFALPPLHRFGFYCAQAFEALDAGDAAGYVRLLREGLALCGAAKEMVEFLLDSTQALKSPSEELSALADQIRAVLGRFSPDDPAVAALKQSEAYQKVAYLIEGLEPPVAGRQLQ